MRVRTDAQWQVRIYTVKGLKRGEDGKEKRIVYLDEEEDRIRRMMRMAVNNEED